MKKTLLAALLAALMLVVLCACGKQETATVRLSEVTHSVFYAPQYVAMELGFFADEGLAIELTNGGGADKVMTAVVSGQSDIGLAGPESCIYIHAQGKDDLPVIFAQLTKRDGSFLVGRSDEAFDWNDLTGRRRAGDDPGICAAAAGHRAPAGRGGGHLGAVQHDGRGLHRWSGGLCDAV